MEVREKSVHATVFVRRRQDKHEEVLLLRAARGDAPEGAAATPAFDGVCVAWEPCSTFEELLVQRLRQTLGLTAPASSLRWCGVLTRLHGSGRDSRCLEINVFELRDWSGEPAGTDAGDAVWCSLDDLPRASWAWADAGLWVEQFLSGALPLPLCGRFEYAGTGSTRMKETLLKQSIAQLWPDPGQSGSAETDPGAALIVSTVSFKQAPEGRARPLESFVRYHLRKGFARILLVLDDPADAAAVAAASRFPSSRVIVRIRDEVLRQEQMEKCSASFAKLEPWMDTDVSSRQLLDAELAMVLAPSLGCTWVLSLDSDELFFTEAPSVRPHFAQLRADGVCQMTYINHEGVPEVVDTADYFATTTLFRQHHFAVPLSGKARDGLRFWMDRSKRGQYMLFYDNGKSACRAGLGARPQSQHLWVLPEECRSCTALADPRRLDVKGYRQCSDPCILHFPICGLSWFLAKYRTLGNFPDTWLGKVKLPACFHSDARDLCSTGADELESKFIGEVLLDDAEEISRQLDCGTCVRLADHATLLDAEPRAPPSGATAPRQAPKKATTQAVPSFAPLDEGPKGIERGWILSKSLGYL